MMNQINVLLISVLAAGTSAQPTPVSGERVDGFVARWDAWVESIPSDQQAWGLIQEVEAEVELVRGDGHGLWFDPEPDPDYLEDQKEWAWTVAFVENNQPLIGKIRAYADRTFTGVPLGESSLIHQRLGSDGYVVDDTPMPKTFRDMVPTHLGLMRSHLDLLLTDMYLASQDGDVDRVLLDLRAIAGMARLSPTTHSFLDQLVVQAFGSVISRQMLEHDVGLDQFNDAQLQELMGILEAVERLYDTASMVQYERMVSTEFLNWIFEDSDDEGRIGPLGVARVVDVGRSNESGRWMGLDEYELGSDQVEISKIAVALGPTFLRPRIAGEHEQREYAKNYFDAVEAELRISLHVLRSWPVATLSSSATEHFISKVSLSPAIHSIEDLSGLPLNLSIGSTQIHAAQMLVALHRFKIRHGEFPSALSDLDADLLAHAPIDGYSGEMLKYKLVDGEPMIYSVGTDRDDDGGRANTDWDGAWPDFLTLDELEALDEPGRAGIDGDWVLYPAVR